jgi:D-alanyl-D-alanine carboxypeptidase/D-alanyl-D-alanine-endopeptidase (penicillin-binding protein 4)
VVDVASGAVLYNALDEPTVPASTMKIVTAASVLDALGADATLRTRAVLVEGRATVPRVVLVGAGDPSLSSTRAKVGGDGTSLVPASLKQLAAGTARSLEARGISRVKVGYDDSLFRGAAMHPSWASSFPAAGIVAPVSALQVDQGRRSPGGFSRVADPAARAAVVFAEQLGEAGVKVRGEPRQRAAEPGSTPLAHVDSPAVGVLVERMLATSDNDYAEALGRLGALGGGEPASFAGVGRRGDQVLADLGIPPAGDRIADASGLSRRNRLTPQTLTDMLQATSDQRASGFGPIRSGLAVAGATGSLRDRYTAPETRPGRGVVRAKTGTLTGVTGLAGLVSRPDGRLLAFAFVDDSTPGGTFGARAALDRAAAELVTCDCAGP